MEHFKFERQPLTKKFNFLATSSFVFNSNLPNLENNNGLYLPKGYGSFNSFFMAYYGRYLTVSAEPLHYFYETYQNDLPDKVNIFSKLNDAERGQHNLFTKIRNLGFLFTYKGTSIGYGNWNHWIGPGVHNSLIMSNNSEGFFNFVIKSKGTISTKKKIYYNIKFLLSDPIKNSFGKEFYIATNEISIKYKNFILAFYTQTLSGANENVDWTWRDAFLVNINRNKIQYWDQINVVNFEYNGLKEAGLILFLTAGLPKNQSLINNNDFYNENSLGSILGLRKYGIFNNEKLHFGFEYLRLVQGIYYNILPTPNWYDSINYDYHSYRNRRWSSHSGSDSDDLLIYFGYINNKFSIMYGINYERHGVTYKFPPEVKIESRFSLTYLLKNNLEISIDYENEYFEHYSFLDQNINVWQQTFEEGSIQRTQTIFFEFKYKINRK